MFMTSGVAVKCVKECERQQTGPVEVAYLINGLECALVHFVQGGQVDDEFVRLLAVRVEPDKNADGFRHTPVVFRNGGSSAPHADIPRLITNWCSAVIDYTNDPNIVWDTTLTKQMIREFLWIHPFKDGNGRVAFILYNFLCGFKKFYRDHTLMFVYPLPDFDWN